MFFLKKKKKKKKKKNNVTMLNQNEQKWLGNERQAKK